MTYRFADCLLDPDRRELTRAGAAVPVEPQVFTLLLHLLEAGDRVVTREELIARVWDGRAISDSTLDSRINAARRAIGDSGQAQAMIRTLPKVGLRFVAPVEAAGKPAARNLARPLPPAALRFCTGADGVRIAYSSMGDGPPVVRVSNWFSHTELDLESPLAAPLIRALSARNRLVRYDSRGNGLSDREVGDISVAAFAGDLGAVISAAGAAPAAIFAQSQGVAVAIAFAAQNPGAVRRMVLHAGFARGRTRRGPEEEAAAEAFIGLMRAGWGDARSAFSGAFASLYMPEGTAEQRRWMVELQRRATSAETAIRIRRSCDALDVEALLPRIACPVLVTHGRDDQVVPLEEGRRIAAAIPGARFLPVESGNHIMLEDEPGWAGWIEEVERFLSDPG